MYLGKPFLQIAGPKNIQHNDYSIIFRFWGLIMFGSFSLINIIVLLNLLIAMMNHSYQLISVSSVSVTNYTRTIMSVF